MCSMHAVLMMPVRDDCCNCFCRPLVVFWLLMALGIRYMMMGDGPISGCGCVLGVLACVRGPRSLGSHEPLGRFHIDQPLGSSPKSSEAYEASASNNACSTFGVHIRAPRNLGVRKCLRPGPTKPRLRRVFKVKL